ncbi:hypothetical protein OAD33_06995 [Alphaproteobacteria bacterium]|nr:hypothetical protein [Alphaproteobacteria bacterium]
MKALLEFNFKKSGSIIKINNDTITFALDKSFQIETIPQVYAWVVNEEIKYIGVAGKGLKNRLNQHNGGWRGGSKTGLKIKNLFILPELQAGNEIFIYSRTSDYIKKTLDIFDETKILNLSLHTYEEEKLITLFDPKWNTVGRKKRLVY